MYIYMYVLHPHFHPLPHLQRSSVRVRNREHAPCLLTPPCVLTRSVGLPPGKIMGFNLIQPSKVEHDVVKFLEQSGI